MSDRSDATKNLEKPGEDNLHGSNNEPRRETPREAYSGNADVIHELFELQAKRTPEATAAVYENQRLTYRELNARANQLDHYLRKLGVGPEVRVGVCTERSLEMVVGVLATLKAGGAYVPLDPSYPKERLTFMMAETQARVVLTQERLLANLPDHGAVPICLDRDWEDVSRESGEDPERKAMAENLAYVIFTSGSTGRPKGVMIEQRSLGNYLRWVNENLISDNVRALPVVTDLTFDASLKQLFGPLLRGQKAWLLSGDIVTQPAALARELGKKVKVGLNCVPHLWAAVLHAIESGEAQMPAESLTCLFVGGERLSQELVNRTLAVLPHLKIWNLYGPTEATANASLAKIMSNEHVTIGRPIANTEIYILDPYLNPVPTGVHGELYIGKGGLARGYVSQPDLTAERFVPNPFGEEPGTRLYRTGDLARYQADGNIEFLGRIDHQVKIRGFRVELGEIEATLNQHSGVHEAVVSAQEDQTGTRRLVAYVVPSYAGREGGSLLSTNQLRSYLGQRLPYYMVPADFLMLAKLPRLPNGKVNRQALTDCAWNRVQSEKTYVGPRTQLEQHLASQWQEVLHIEKVGIDDNFFDLGGDSITGATFLNRLQNKLGEYLYILSLIEAPTVAQYAEYLATHYSNAVSGSFPETKSQPSEAAGEKSASTHRGRIDTSAVAQLRRLIPSIPPRDDSTRVRPKNRPAIFVFSPPRSGSTLFRVMLAGHPRLFAPPELNLLSFNTLAERKPSRSNHSNFRFLEGTIRALMEIKACKVEEARQIMGYYESQNLTTKEFYRLLQEWIGEQILVDKSTSYELDIDTLKRAEEDFENAKYIHLLRHPYGMIRSFEEVRMDRIFFPHGHSFSVRELAELIWLVSHQNVLEFLKGVPSSRQMRVKFAELVNHPADTMMKVCRFLGLEFCPAIAQPYKDKERRMTDGIYPVSKMIGDMRFHEHRNIDPGVAERWKEDYAEDWLGDITWEVAASLGYEKEPPLPQHDAPLGEDHLDQLVAELEQMSEEKAKELVANSNKE